MRQFQNEMEKEAGRQIRVLMDLQGCDRGHFMGPITIARSTAQIENFKTQVWCYRFSNPFGSKD